ncbi:MAG TPA: 1-deoxy-D-xylulose-5-phosphate synthase, partial [Gammaproteobacteria bacterium]|nr:1-deoxy-D-xylulose-5-phosphate synthase [Gammaproteobacteria bacterium]
RDGSKNVLSIVPPVWELARKAEEHMKGMVVPGTLFEELGFNYIGPIDGHDLSILITTLRNLRERDEPQFLHIVTRKGKGYPPAEENPTCYHGVAPFDPETGEIRAGSGAPTYTELFGSWICDMADRDQRLVGITPAMCEGSGLVEFARRFPERYFDVGIAEQHAVTLAAGMACDGLKPVVAIYSTFLQRAYDQLIHDVALQNLPVLFAIDRAGLVGHDGPTHAGSFDLSYLRCIPNLVIMAPADGNELRRMLYTGFLHDGPVAVRYPRGSGPEAEIEQEIRELVIGKGRLCREGRRIALIAFGSMVAPALQAAEQLDASVVNMRFIKPLDKPLLLDMARHHDLLVTVEENAVAGGAGSAVNECLEQCGVEVPILNLGLPDRFVEHGRHSDLLAQCGLDADGIARSVRARLKE